MSDHKSGSSGKRLVWIGAGAAAVAMYLAGRYIDFPPKGDDTSGTIAPAQRYRADQPGASDVKLGGQSDSTPGAQSSSAGDSRVQDGHADSHVSDKNADSHVSDKNADSHVSDKNADSHVSDKNADSHVSDKNADSHVSDKNADSHVSDKNMNNN